MHSLKNRLARSGITIEMYMKMRQTDEESLKAEMRSSVIDNIKRSLVLFKVAKTEGIEVKPEDVKKEAADTLESLTNQMTRDQMRKIDQERLMVDVLTSKMMERVTDRVWELLIQIAKGDAPAGKKRLEKPKVDKQKPEKKKVEKKKAEQDKPEKKKPVKKAAPKSK